MGYYKYLIIGGGMTADAAALGIREVTQALNGLISGRIDMHGRSSPSRVPFAEDLKRRLRASGRVMTRRTGMMEA